jgi:hypothetical protein
MTGDDNDWTRNYLREQGEQVRRETRRELLFYSVSLFYGVLLTLCLGGLYVLVQFIKWAWYH